MKLSTFSCAWRIEVIIVIRGTIQAVYVSYRIIGRLNLLTCLLNCPNELMFSKMKGKNELPAGTKGEKVMGS